jgi:D-arabinose 1-dehydrogenase-like Zn-dependent alcohol dehydrogenase
VLGALRADVAQVDVRRFYFDQSSILGTTMASPGDYARFFAHIETLPDFDVAVDSAWPLEQAAEAHRAMEAGKQFGHLVLDIPQEGLA